MKQFLPIREDLRVGGFMGDVIDFNSRLKARHKESSVAGQVEGQITDITELRLLTLKEERRAVKRTLLTEFIAVHTVVPGCGLLKVNLFDINEKGLSFDIEMKKGQFQASEEVAMRVYLNHQTYFPFVVKIKHITDIVDEQVHRHGAEYVQGAVNDVALHHFIKFIENVSASLKHDKGDVLVSNINS